LRGIAFAVWTLAAFAIGALAGVLIRRVLPAMFATLAAWSGLALATALLLRPHYRGALRTTNPNIGFVVRPLRSSASGGRCTASPPACPP